MTPRTPQSPTRAGDVEIFGDGKNVWVNAADGSCIGRFTVTLGRALVDVHRTASDQIAGGRECLDCISNLAPEPAWCRFKSSMLRHHGVQVSDDVRPGRVQAGNSVISQQRQNRRRK